jgi:CTP synthase (UTP-ammonia lyase)
VSRKTIALVGDYSDRHTAHRAVPRALELARALAGVDVAWEWVPTRRITDPARDLASFAAVWLVPASPYESMEGALGAVRWAREGKRPFLGTCGGFQHALLEFGRNVAGIPAADHAETSPGAADLVITRLSCSLVETSETLRFLPGSLLSRAYADEPATEAYRCSYGFNPAFRDRFEANGFRFTAFEPSGEIRGAEIPNHRFFAGVLFQPERAALRGVPPPLAVAFVSAVAAADHA